ncbi:unnamed protein product [Prorocentrum cordatum]|uniref:Uncharacterized protein n=1 Tax=Prorocentrum cordatum TaxID=2364126 RepID=A0ABN9QHN3_9DINO|nr:unnamed protein product [Polarella glacialis]
MDLHLELAAAFQATTVDAFASDPSNPVRRLLDPFIHRSVQATNDNFRLLFDYKAAEFSLAPLPYDEQLKLIDESIRERPLNLAHLDISESDREREPNQKTRRHHEHKVFGGSARFLGSAAPEARCVCVCVCPPPS